MRFFTIALLATAANAIRLTEGDKPERTEDQKLDALEKFGDAALDEIDTNGDGHIDQAEAEGAFNWLIEEELIDAGEADFIAGVWDEKTKGKGASREDIKNFIGDAAEEWNVSIEDAENFAKEVTDAHKDGKKGDKKGPKPAPKPAAKPAPKPVADE